MRNLVVLAVIAAGGGAGAVARHALGLAWPAAGVTWATLTANLVGCGLIGVLMVLITEVWAGHWVLRPFLGIGVLGGFTTFSTYAVGVHRLLAADRPVLAIGYLVGTVVAALVATWFGVVAARRLTRKAR